MRKIDRFAKSIPSLTQEELTRLSQWVHGVLVARLGAPTLINELAASIEQGSEQTVKTNFERILDELKAEGKEEGIKEGIKEVTKGMLMAGIPLEEIMRITKLPREQIEELP